MGGDGRWTFLNSRRWSWRQRGENASQRDRVSCFISDCGLSDCSSKATVAFQHGGKEGKGKDVSDDDDDGDNDSTATRLTHRPSTRDPRAGKGVTHEVSSGI